MPKQQQPPRWRIKKIIPQCVEVKRAGKFRHTNQHGRDIGEISITGARRGIPPMLPEKRPSLLLSEGPRIAMKRQ